MELDLAQRSEVTVLHELVDRYTRRDVAEFVRDGAYRPGALGGRKHFFTLGHVQAERLLAQDVLAASKGGRDRGEVIERR